jgi:hypothetical protein
LSNIDAVLDPQLPNSMGIPLTMMISGSGTYPKSMVISQEILEPLDLLLVQPLPKLTSRVNPWPKNALFWLMENLHLSVEIICAMRCKKYVHLQTFKF